MRTLTTIISVVFVAGLGACDQSMDGDESFRLGESFQLVEEAQMAEEDAKGARAKAKACLKSFDTCMTAASNPKASAACVKELRACLSERPFRDELADHRPGAKKPGAKKPGAEQPGHNGRLGQFFRQCLKSAESCDPELGPTEECLEEVRACVEEEIASFVEHLCEHHEARCGELNDAPRCEKLEQVCEEALTSEE